MCASRLRDILVVENSVKKINTLVVFRRNVAAAILVSEKVFALRRLDSQKLLAPFWRVLKNGI